MTDIITADLLDVWPELLAEDGYITIQRRGLMTKYVPTEQFRVSAGLAPAPNRRILLLPPKGKTT